MLNPEWPANTYPSPPPKRPLISFDNGVFFHNGVKVKIVMTSDIISVGCSDITREALEKLNKVHMENFPIFRTIQEGE